MDLKIFASHPVQYHVPFYRALVNSGLEIEVRYYHQGTAGRLALDQDFGIEIEWDLDLLNGYPRQFCMRGTANYSLLEQLRVLPGLLAWALKDRRVPLLLMGWFAELVWLAWLLRIVGQMPVIIFSETTPQSFAYSPKPRWRTALLGWLLRRTPTVLYIGTQNRIFYEQMGVPFNRLFFTPYSIDNQRFGTEIDRMQPQKKKLKEANGLDPDLPVFLFCGKLIHRKRPLELFDAYLQAGLQDKAQLLFVGEGVLRPEIQSKISNSGAKHVRLLGFLNQSQMPLAYVLGDVLCLLSGGTETWGLVVNEALVGGLPVIVSTAVGCGADLVSDQNGWIVPLDDMDQLAKTLRNAFDRRNDWHKMGMNGKKRISRHTHTSMAAGVLSAMRLINSNKSSVGIRSS